METVSNATAGPQLPLGDYRPAAGAYDEMFLANGEVRPHCRQFLAEIATLGRADLTQRWEQVARFVRENGMVYHAYGDPATAVRPWNLDAFPLIIPAQEWQDLAQGLVQRARLLNAILADLYGPQALLAKGLVPAGLVFGNPGFARPFHGQHGPGDRYLHLYAVDLARASDGQWWVVGDRTDSPLGMAYALENRIAVSRMLPSVIHDCQVQRLASFFIDLQDTLRAISKTNRENPRIVLLSQGPQGPNYFEDAYLARYLGYTLVEGADLTVRENRVKLKTLAGLLQVDVVLRRLSDQFCDPLELRGNPTLGVPGLLQAQRSGNVVIANALGSSLVESPALMPFLPGLSRELLGEDLRLPFLATWWCGQERPRKHVLEHLDSLCVRSAFRVGRVDQVPRDELNHTNAETLTQQVCAHPGRFVAQESLIRSTAPVWSKREPRSLHVALRAFVVASGGSFTVLPGGLVRVSADSNELDLSILAGEGSKDAWVLSEGPVQTITLLQPHGKAELRRSGAELPSRVADNLFWLGRRIERAESATRLLRPILSRLTSESEREAMPELSELLRTLAAQGQIEPGFVVDGVKDQLPAIENALPSSILDVKQSGSLRYTVAAMYRNASLVRDRMSVDSWRIILRLEQQIDSLARKSRVQLTDVLELLNAMIINLAAFGGLVSESMTRTQGWRFLDLGRRLERSLKSISLVQDMLLEIGGHETAAMEAVLEVVDSTMTYRSRYLANLQLPMVLDLLLTDETNPRSLVFQLEQILAHVEALPRDDNQPLRGADQRIAISTLNRVRMIDLTMLNEASSGGARTKLRRTLQWVGAQLPRLSELISHKYLIHADVPRQLADS